MTDDHGDEQQHFFGEAGVPLLHPPLSPDEHRRKEEKEAEDAYKERQLSLSDASVRTAQSNLNLTRALTIFTALTAIAAFVQGYIANKSATAAVAAVGAAHDTLSKMQGQIDEAKNANAIAKDALQSVQRAFLIQSPIFANDIDPTTHEQRGLNVNIRWDNSGDTPTRNMTALMSFQERVNPITEKIALTDVWDPRISKIITPGLVGPKGHANVGLVNIPWPLVTNVYLKKTHFYVWGWARYRDVFKDTPNHITRYCLELAAFGGNYSSASGKLVDPIVTFLNCPFNNCSDDECKVQ